ncbi:MAG: GGDEF domain-containing protein [Proteobacteria bacterium]|nr:GGDEF domain-containing protein [Pseudomonadota bacterium]
MTIRDDNDNNEEIQGAPPVSSDAEQREKRLTARVDINRYLLLQARQLEIMLLDATSLTALLDVLLVSMPRHFSFRVAELWLYDPENSLQELILGGERYGQYLQLRDEVFSMQELYDIEPDIVLIDATDSRMFEVLKTDHGIDHAILLPLMDSGRLIGSFHCGLSDASLYAGEAAEDLVAHLAALTSICIKNAVRTEKISRLSVLDPLTQMSNPRGFERDLSREISRAQRVRQPLTLLKMEIDEYTDLRQQHGEVSCQFVIKKVTQRVTSDLRATDYIARISGSVFFVIVPGCGEVKGQEIAERMREDIEDFAIDDGRGAILHVTLSMGLVTWEPEHYPAVDMPRLAQQIQAVADKGLQASLSKNGNQISIARLSTLMV